MRRDTNDIDNDLDGNEDHDNSGGGGVWDLLSMCTERLHNMATLIMSLLGIPQNVALSNGECRCRDGND